MDPLIRTDFNDFHMPILPPQDNNRHIAEDFPNPCSNDSNLAKGDQPLDLINTPKLTPNNQANLSPNIDLGGNIDNPVSNQLGETPCTIQKMSSATSRTREFLVIDEDIDDANSPNARSPNKRKLLPVTSHGSSKVLKTNQSGPFFAETDSNRYHDQTLSTTSNLVKHAPALPSSILRNHTVTSATSNDDSILDLTMPGTSREIIPNRQHDFLHNQVFMGDKHIEIDLTQDEFAQVGDHVNMNGGLTNKDHDVAMFYQLLGIFPDIDLNFLREQCSLGSDIDQVIENILQLEDYPKDIKEGSKVTSQASNIHIPLPSQSVVVNVNINTFQPPISCFSNTISNVTGSQVEGGFNEKNRNDNRLNGMTLNPVSNSKVTTPTSSSSKNDSLVTNGVLKMDHEINDSGSDFSMASRMPNSIITNTSVCEEKPSLTAGDDNDSDQFSFLMGIFPEADPKFMEAKSKLEKDALGSFIAESLEKQDYPRVTVEQKNKKKENKVEDESTTIGLYTTDFNLESFIKIFPDPLGYFLDEKRKCNYTEHGFSFLKRRYRLHSVKRILTKYKEFNFNLIKTCEYLDADMSTSRATKRTLSEIRMPEKINLPFLQEACFIEHKDEIKKYLDGILEAKRLAYEQAAARGELIECGCCYNDVMFEDCVTCNEGHLFCKDCVKKSVEVKVGDGLTTFPCLQDCGAMFALKVIETLVDATMFSRLLQRIQLDEVRAADIEGLEDCPFCDFAIILPPETSIFKCLNPECLKESCRKCHRLSHIPQRCEELESDDQARARKYIEDEMTRALVRTCYKCKSSFIKTDGCNKMTCTCGAKMCYICRQPITDYKHFSGQGSGDQTKCPLYSSDKILNVDIVEAVAKKAKEEIEAKNPELKLKHDPTKILPSAASVKATVPPGINEDRDRLLNVLQNLNQDLLRVENAVARVAEAARVPAAEQRRWEHPANLQAPALLRVLRPARNPALPRGRPVEIPALPQAGPAEIPALPRAGPADNPPQAGPAEIPALPRAGPAEIPALPRAGPAEIPALPRAGPAEIPALPRAGPAEIPPPLPGNLQPGANANAAIGLHRTAEDWLDLITEYLDGQLE